MVNRPKKIGTRDESAVVAVVQSYWPTAERLALHGVEDQGDIGNCGDVVFEVKGGEMAGRQQPGDITRWMLETERERKNRGVRFGVLVTKRTGYGTTAAGHWWAWLNVAALADLMGATGHRNASVVRLELSDLLDIFADMGLTADSPSFDRASA